MRPYCENVRRDTYFTPAPTIEDLLPKPHAPVETYLFIKSSLPDHHQVATFRRKHTASSKKNQISPTRKQKL